MKRHALAYLFLVSCVTSPALAQSSLPIRPDSYDGAWIQVDLSGAASAAGMLQILARNVDDPAPSTRSVGASIHGIGAAGNHASAPAIKAETGFDPVKNRSEEIVIAFGRAVTRAALDLTFFYPDEINIEGVSYHERGGWRAFRGIAQVGEGLFISDAADGNYRLTIKAPTDFDRLEIYATPYVTAGGAEIAPGRVLTDSSDFLIKYIGYEPAGAEQSAAAR